MKRFLQIAMRAVIIASIVIFIGSCIYQYTDYKQHPEIYMLNSAPWYTGLLIQGAISLFIVLICIIVLVVIGRKKQ